MSGQTSEMTGSGQTTEMTSGGQSPAKINVADSGSDAISSFYRS